MRVRDEGAGSEKLENALVQLFQQLPVGRADLVAADLQGWRHQAVVDGPSRRTGLAPHLQLIRVFFRAWPEDHALEVLQE